MISVRASIDAIGGKVASVDLFDSPELFAQYREQLLDALYVTAAELPSGPSAAPPAAAEVRDFFAKARAAPKREHARGAAKAFEHQADGVVGVELMAKPPAAAKDAAPVPVYESYQPTIAAT